MNHRGTKTIETKRLTLRAFRMSDVEAAFGNWMSDKRVTEFLRWQTHADVSESRQIIASWIDLYDSPDFYQWAIVLKELGEPIGTISVVEKNEELDIVHIGYCIGSAWWGQGITTEAFRAIIPFLFDEVGANRIESQHDPNNPGSGAVMRKCGLRYEGTLRQADFNNRGIVDAAVYGLLRSEWHDGQDAWHL
jgi:ribosomal-protein-alanine N-acetyltransferase